MRRSAFAVLLVLAACGPASDPASSPRVVTPLGLEPPPIYSLLGYRQELDLTSEQITALDSIAEAVRRQNAPLVQELRDRTPLRAQQRGLVVVDVDSQPLLTQLRENNRVAMDAVGSVLTEQQRETACRVFEQPRNGRVTRAQQPRTGTRRTPGAEPTDSLLTGTRGWIWCGVPVPTRDTLPAS